MLLMRIGGDWRLEVDRPPLPELLAGSELRFDCAELGGWDSSLLTYLRRLLAQAESEGVAVDLSGLPEGVARLLTLAGAVPAHRPPPPARLPLLAQIGAATRRGVKAVANWLAFLGELVLAFIDLLRGRPCFRRSDFIELLNEVGPRALPIVTLINLLVGMILALVGAVTLQVFGVAIYVVNLVVLGMTREMGAAMTAVVVTGRTGASFAAHLGSMQANEEIDALRALGLSPMAFLVLPRVLALALMMPLLCIYADLMGLIGGALICMTLLDITLLEYWNQAVMTIRLNHVAAGLIKAAVFGVVIALAGCLRGMQSGRSAAAVGEATTSAVVTAVVSIVLADALLTVLYNAFRF